MVFIIIYNDPLNLKVHVFHAMCILKPEMKHLLPPPHGRDAFRTIIFRHLSIYLFNICYFELKILGQEQLMGHFTQ